jgi:hypothetical protein
MPRVMAEAIEPILPQPPEPSTSSPPSVIQGAARGSSFSSGRAVLSVDGAEPVASPGTQIAAIVERRLSERPADIREAARGLSRAILKQVDELQASKPNDPDALTRQEAFISFMQGIATGLDELAAPLERVSTEASASRGPLYAKSAEIARRLGRSVTKGLEENRASIMACSLRVPWCSRALPSSIYSASVRTSRRGSRVG